MPAFFRNYTKQPGITSDYYKVRNFLIKLGIAEFTYARWDWMITHGYLEKSALSKIGIWEEEEKIVGLAIFDCQPGEAFCLTLLGHESLKKEILLYAKDNLSNNGKFGVVISDTDYKLQDVAAELGFIATEKKESDAIFYLKKTLTKYNLPQGFHITSLKSTFDLYQYGRILWRGFNHELNGEGKYKFTKEQEQALQTEMIRPNVDLSIKIAVVAPNNNFVSYCGMWYEPALDYAVIEPVATDPDYRKMGLGKAAVLEGVHRVRKLGAKKVLVGSSQQFYYSIGMRPFATATIWK